MRYKGVHAFHIQMGSAYLVFLHFEWAKCGHNGCSSPFKFISQQVCRYVYNTFLGLVSEVYYSLEMHLDSSNSSLFYLAISLVCFLTNYKQLQMYYHICIGNIG